MGDEGFLRAEKKNIDSFTYRSKLYLADAEMFSNKFTYNHFTRVTGIFIILGFSTSYYDCIVWIVARMKGKRTDERSKWR